MTLEQAVQVSRDVRGQRMFPVHWSTFNLAYHDWDERARWSMPTGPSSRRAGGRRCADTGRPPARDSS